MSEYGHWVVPFNFNPADYEGFIYIIENNINNKRYVGKKNFKSLRRLKPLKGKKNKRHRYSDSNWPVYTSSSKYVCSDIESFGKCNFTFSIIHLCKNKSQMAYYEPFYMYKYNVLTERDHLGNRTWYNMRIPGCKSIPKL